MYSGSTESEMHLCNAVLLFNLGFSVVLPFYLPPKLLFSFTHFKKNDYFLNLMSGNYMNSWYISCFELYTHCVMTESN